MSDKLIDVEKVIASKNPKLLKRIPGFIIRYLKRIVHQEDLNKIISDYHDTSSSEFIDHILEDYHVHVHMHNVENVPQSGGVILAANHPIGGLDALAVVHKFYPYRNDIKFIVNDLLLNLKNLKDLFVGVNKHGATAISTLHMVDELFQSDKAVFVFPAGLVSRKIKGQVMDLEWKKTFITRAKKYHKPIVPVYIEGKLSNFFYRLANFRKFLGIKTNLEMLYLADEQFKQSGKTINIIFGKPISPEELNASHSDKEWASRIKEMAYALRDKLDQI